jgi:hypothetical protein
MPLIPLDESDGHKCFEAKHSAATIAAEYHARGHVVRIVRCDAHSGRWRVLRCAVAAREAVPLDELRAHEPTQWGAVYAQLCATHAANATLGAAGLEVRGHGPIAGPITVHHGVAFWRHWFGVPNRPTAALVAHHKRSDAQWRVPMREPRDADERAYAEAVRALAVWLAERFCEACGRRRAFDRRAMRAAVLHAGFRVALFDPGSRLSGALFPLHCVRGTEPDLADNRRVLAVRVLPPHKIVPLLAHELAHALFVPLWLPENHPPAFAAAMAELGAILASHPPPAALGALVAAAERLGRSRADDR